MMSGKFISMRVVVDALALTLGFALHGAAFAQMQQQLKSCGNLDETANVIIASCTAAIQSGQFSGKTLAALLYNRGMGYHRKQDFDHALADLKEASRLDPNGGWYRPVTEK